MESPDHRSPGRTAGSGSLPVSRRRLLALGGASLISVALVSVSSVVASCAAPATDGVWPLFGSRTAAVRAVGVAALNGGPLSGVTPAEVVGMLPTEGIDTTVDGTRLVIGTMDPVRFSAALIERSTVELAAGSLQPVAGYLLTPTEMALAAAVAMSTA